MCTVYTYIYTYYIYNTVSIWWLYLCILIYVLFPNVWGKCLGELTVHPSVVPCQVQRFLSQPFFVRELSFSGAENSQLPSVASLDSSEVAEIFTGTPGAFVDLETTINDFEEVSGHVLWMVWTFKCVKRCWLWSFGGCWRKKSHHSPSFAVISNVYPHLP